MILLIKVTNFSLLKYPMMLKGLFAHSAPLTKILISFFVMIASLTLFMGIGFALAPLFFDVSMSDLSNLTTGETANVNILKYFQVIQSVALFVIPPFIIAWLVGVNHREYLSIKTGTFPSNLIIIPMLMVSVIPFINFLAELNSRLDLPSFLTGVEDWMKEMEESGQEVSKKFMDVQTTGGMIFNLFMIAFLPAIGEEFLFRGVFQKQFSELTGNKHWGIILAAFLFSLMHLQFFGLIPRFALGLLMGYLLLWGKTIWLPVTAHFLNNGIIVVFYYFYTTGGITYDLENMGKESSQNIQVLVSLGISLLMLALVYKNRHRINQHPA